MQKWLRRLFDDLTGPPSVIEAFGKEYEEWAARQPEDDDLTPTVVPASAVYIADSGGFSGGCDGGGCG